MYDFLYCDLLVAPWILHWCAHLADEKDFDSEKKKKKKKTKL